MKIRKFITNYSIDEINEIISLYQSGMSCTAISSKFNIVRKVIKKILVQNNVWIENRDDLKIKFSEEDINKMLNLYVDDKLSTLKIAKIYNVSKTSIKRILRENSVLRKGNSNGVKINLSESQKEKIENLYLYDYANTKEIGESLNLSASYVDKYLNGTRYRRNKSNGASVGLVRRFSGIKYDEYLKNLPEQEKYRREVIKLTNKQSIHTLKNYDKRGDSGIEGAYHLDHKYSILEGFKNKIKPEIIASLNNLVFIPWRDNVVKRTKCSITKEELINC